MDKSVYNTVELESWAHRDRLNTLAIGSTNQIERGEMATSYEALVKEPIRGMLYFVCKKQLAQSS